MKMNERQLQAVHETKKDLLVMAGAGTGKTRVLTEKFLYLIENEGMDPRRIVAITFTHKAAFEMRTRIRTAIEDRITNSAPELSRIWQRHYEDLPFSYIGTFHGFCQKVLHDFATLSATNPHQRILSQGEERILLNQAAERASIRLLREGKPEEQQNFGEIVMEFGLPFVLEQIKELLPQMRESGTPVSLWFEQTRRARHGTSEAFLRLREAVNEILQSEYRKQLTPRSQGMLSEIEAEFGSLLPQEDMIIGDVSERVSRLKSLLPKNLGAKVREIVDSIHEELEAVMSAVAEREFYRWLPGVERYINILADEYGQLKLENSGIDFSDLQLKTRDLLKEREDIRKICHSKYDYFMVDEFQDTNMLQLEIVRLLVGEGHQKGRLFVVGDPKQSIYRFRGAQVQVVDGLSRELGERNGLILPLQENYRCHSVIIDGINAVFEQLFSNESVQYHPLISGLLGINDEHRNPRIEVLTSQMDRNDEAERIARYINFVVEVDKRFVSDDNVVRRIKYGDIAVLFRAMTHLGEYEAALRRWGIPYHTAGGTGYYGLQEVQDQLSLIRLIHNSYDEVSLIALLRSPYCGLSDEVLYWLARTESGLVNCFYYEHKRPEFVGSSEWVRLLELRKLINGFQEKRASITVSEIVRSALEQLGYTEIICALPQAERCLANLEKILRKADEFSNNCGRYGLGEFLDYIGDLVAIEEREGEAHLETEGDNVVELLTIHAAKGLEFPLIIVADMERQFNLTERSSAVIHLDHGIGFKVPDGRGEMVETPVRRLIKEKNKREELSELKRLFYVALTRAKEYLMLSGLHIDAKSGTEPKSWADWLRTIVSFEPDNQRAVLGGHPINVIHDFPDTNRRKEQEEIDWQMRSETAAAFEVSIPKTMIESPRFTRLSVTGLLNYVNCPREYFLRYKMGVRWSNQQEQTGRKYGVLIGSIIHSLCAMELLTDVSLEVYLKNSLRAVDSSERNEIKHNILKLWSAYCTSPYPKLKGETFSEYPFTIPMGKNLFLHGILDRLVLTEEGPILVDFKTDQVQDGMLREVVDKYLPQLWTYSIAVREIFGVYPIRAELFFMSVGKIWKTECEPRMMEEWHNRLIGAANSMPQTHDINDYPPSADCENCPKKVWCGNVS